MKHLSDADIDRLVTYEDAIAVMDDAFRRFGRGEAAVQPRIRTDLGKTKLSTLGAVIAGENVAGAKVYTTVNGQFTFVILLFSAVDGRPLGTLDGNSLTRLRTGAVSAVAAKALAREDAGTLAVFGTGVQARGHIAAYAASRKLKDVRVVSRGDASGFASEITRTYGVPARAADTATALDGADLVVTATRSVTPIFSGDGVMPGAFVAAVGSSRPDTREIDDALIARADPVVVEWKAQTRLEAGDLLLTAPGVLDWDRVVDLGDVLVGRAPGRTSRESVTLFESVGIGLEDIALAAFAWRKAGG